MRGGEQPEANEQPVRHDEPALPLLRQTDVRTLSTAQFFLTQDDYLILSHMELSLFEREVSERGMQQQLALAVRAMLDDAKRYFDVIFVDCPPGISILTEMWLRECDFFMPPTRRRF